MRTSQRRLIKWARWVFTLVVLVLTFYLSESQEHESIQPQEKPVLYSNVCRDHLEEIYVQAVRSAQQSVLLIIYSLNDTKLIGALNTQSAKGIKVKVIHDLSTPSLGFQDLAPTIETQGAKSSGLMHQKILVIDHERILLGSANMTTESLKLHDNLVIGLINPQLAETIEQQESYLLFTSGEQLCEYWSFPKKGKDGLNRLITLIDEAQISLRVAMFTWTHSKLTQAVIRAHERGVAVTIVLDQGQANGVCLSTLHALQNAGIDVRLSNGLGLLHHKLAWIDEKILVNGSANWTVAAFSRNQDCFMILHDLTEYQNNKLHHLWRKTKLRSTKCDDSQKAQAA